MKTYQDLMEKIDNLSELTHFMQSAIADYQASDMYKWAKEGDAYFRQQNTTIMRYQKLLYTISGKAVPDNYTANHKCASNFLDFFVTQENQYLLGNGVEFNENTTKDRLGTKRDAFDTRLQDAGEAALWGGVAYGFFNVDHVEVFNALEFVPLWNEETGALMAGIRFWQIDDNKPLRVTLYEVDGYTEFIKRKSKEMEILEDKRAYKLIVNSSEVDGMTIVDGENYPAFPIVPLWGNKKHQSTLVGLKQSIDCYDLIKSGFANDLDDASLIYWTLENAGGMDDIDLAKFIEHMKTVKAAVTDDNVKAEAHTMDVPYQSRETYLTRLQDDLFRDAQALDIQKIAAGQITATAINAAYQLLDNKCDKFEYCVIQFIQGVLYLIGIDDDPTFKRSKITNQTEHTNMILSAAQYLDTETVLKHLPFLNTDEIDNILDNLTREEANRFTDAEE